VLLSWTSPFRRVQLGLKALLVRKDLLVQLVLLALKALQEAFRLAPSPHLMLAAVPLSPIQATPVRLYLISAFHTEVLALLVLLAQLVQLDHKVPLELLDLKVLRARLVRLVVQRLSICSALPPAMLTLAQAS
jgi:hypothetical protein